ncbi:MAG: hypothetical protein QOI43_1428 [Gaiellales bacterium]|nr:hypothetical protein [Gaiellales bacterium]
MRSLLGLCAADVLLSLLGAGVLMAVGTWDRLPRMSRVGPSLLVGFAASAVALPPLLYAGIAPTPLVVGAIAAIALGAGSALRRRREQRALDASGGGLLAGLIFAVLIAPFVVRAALEPMLKFDAYADWSLKARLIYGHGGLILGAFDPDTLGRLYQAGHREYPLGLPTTEAFAFHMAGGTGSRIVHLQCVLVFVAFAATAWSMLRPRVDAAILGGVLCLLVVAPSLHTQILSTYADVPLACFWALAAVALGLWFAGDGDDRLALATLLAAAALATKQEGLVLDASLFAIALAYGVTRSRRNVPSLALAVGVIVVTALPWQIRVHALGLHDADIAPSGARMARQAGSLPTIVHRLAGELVGARWPAIVPLAVGVALWLAWARRDRLALAFLGVLTAAMIGLAVIYWNARIPVAGLLVQSAERVVTGPVFLAVVTLPLLLDRLARPPGGSTPAQRPDPRPRRAALRMHPGEREQPQRAAALGGERLE